MKRWVHIPDDIFEAMEKQKEIDAIHNNNKPRRLPLGFPPSDAAEFYEKAGNHAMDEWQIHKAGIYFEWAKIEREKANANG